MVYDRADTVAEYLEGIADEEGIAVAGRWELESQEGRAVTVWDVQTRGERYWVFSNPVNRYAHRLLPSAELAHGFHAALVRRIAALRAQGWIGKEEDAWGSAWELLESAGEVYARTPAGAGYRAVGQRCRDCLATTIHHFLGEPLVNAGHRAPVEADFLHWAEALANAAGPGVAGRDLRSHLKTVSRVAWDRTARLLDGEETEAREGELALKATFEVIQGFMLVVAYFREPGGQSP